MKSLDLQQIGLRELTIVETFSVDGGLLFIPPIVYVVGVVAAIVIATLD